MKGLILNIQRFSIHDGPGIRTTVFFKGCNLDCWWCHNPESKKNFPELLFYYEKCILCLTCVKNCTTGALSFNEKEKKIFYDKEKCKKCFKCNEVCPTETIVKCGEYKNVYEVVNEVMKDEEFYITSNGGVTVSGGEPLLQSNFVSELFKELKKKKIHTVIETAGCVKWELFEKVLPYTDLFLYDFKSGDAEKLKKATGGDINLITENLKKLIKKNKEVIIRIPVVPDFNSNEDEITKITEILNEIKNKVKVEPLKFNFLGKNKYKALNLSVPYKKITDEIAEETFNRVKESLKKENFVII